MLYPGDTSKYLVLQQKILNDESWSNFDITGISDIVNSAGKLFSVFSSQKTNEAAIDAISNKNIAVSNAYQAALASLSSKPKDNSTMYIILAAVAVVIIGIVLYTILKK